MTALLEKAGVAFLRAFGIAFLLAAPGILGAKDVGAAKAASIAMLVGAIAGGIKAVQVFVPQISFAAIMGQPYAAWVDSFTRAFIGSFFVYANGWLAAPDWGTWKSAGLAAITGALTAGVRALQGLLTPGETPVPASGVKTAGA